MKANLRGWPLLSEPQLRAVLAALDGEARATRIVGGAVRDALIGRTVTDADLATTFVPTDVIARAEAAGLKVVPTGIEHGTVTVIAQGKPFEVTTLRRDVETDGRHAVVAFTDDWKEDASRRDFTMNALYCDVAGEVLDPLGGMPDLEAGLVRFVGNPDDRIREDYLRILRFFRFFAWYGEGRPGAEGLKACGRQREGLATLSAERVWAELKRLLRAPDPGRALLWMRTTEILQKVLPESWGIDAVPRLVAAERVEGWDVEPLARVEAMLPPDRARIEGLAERLRLSRAEARRLLDWADAPEVGPATSEKALAQLLYANGPRGVRDRLRLTLASAMAKDQQREATLLRRLLRAAETWTKPSFPVSGKDVVARGVEQGPDVGERLKQLEERWIASGFKLTASELLDGE